MSSSGPIDQPPRSADEPSKSRITPKTVGGVVLLILGLVFIFENTREVKIRFILPEITAPLWVALLAAAAIGALVFWLLQRRRKTD